MATGEEYADGVFRNGINENADKLHEKDSSGGGNGAREDFTRPRHLVEKVDFPPLKDDQPAGDKFGIDVFRGVKMKVSGEIGKTTIRVRDLINLHEGSMLRLDRLADENLTMLVNEAPFAYGEIVVINDRYGVRIASFIDEDNKEDT